MSIKIVEEDYNDEEEISIEFLQTFFQLMANKTSIKII